MDEHRAIVTVPEDQQSLAIGKEGQNARLANKLTKWKIDIKGMAGISGNVDEKGFVTSKSEQKRVVGVWDEEIKKQGLEAEAAQSKKDQEENSTEENAQEEVKENLDDPVQK